MPVSQGDIIRATHFNDLRDKVVSVLGNGVGDLGYGQIPKSKPAKAPRRNDDGTTTYDIINRFEWDNLIDDMSRCREHQTGLEHRMGGTLPSINNATEISADIYNDLEIFANTIFNERQNIAITPGPEITVQGAVSAPLVQKSYSSNWNQKLYLIVTCQFQPVSDEVRQFTASDSARHFFNAGGEIRLQLDIDNVNSKKEEEYQQMFDDFGVVRIRANDTTNGTGTTNRGFNQLTTSDQQVWNMAGRGYYYYAYSNNDIIVTAQTNSDKSAIVVTIELRDDDYGNIDEPVDATITGTVTTLQPTGDNVALDNPTFTSTNWSGSYTAPQAPTPPPPPPPDPDPQPSGSEPSPSVQITVNDSTGGIVWNMDTGTSGSVRVTSPTGTILVNRSLSSSDVVGNATFSTGDYGIYTASITSSNAFGNGSDTDTESVSQPPNTLSFPTPTVAPSSWPITVTGTPNTSFRYQTSSPDTPGYKNLDAVVTLNSNGVFQTTGNDESPSTVDFVLTFDTGSPRVITKRHVAT